MVHKVLEITNADGLRAQAASAFVQTASRFSSQIIIEKGNKKINAKSIMGVLSLGIASGETIHLVVTGDDEKAAVGAIAQLVKTDFAQ